MDISIIVPCYNAAGKIEACLDSLKNIDYPTSKYEVIFVDDCSKDNTFAYLTEQAKAQSHWRVLQLPQNSGSPSQPRNLGVSQARGEYVFFLDCDDEIFSDTLAVHFHTAKKQRADIVRGYLMVDDGNRRYAANQLQEDLSGLDKQAAIRTIIGKQSTTVPSLIKRSVLETHQIQWHSDLRMGEDTVYLAEVLSVAQKIVYINHPTFIYNKKINAEASSTQSYGSRELKNHLIVWQTAQEKLAKQGVNYYQIRLQVGLQTAIQSMIAYNRFDINKTDFTLLADFINQNKKLIETFNYNERIKSVLSFIYQEDYQGFLNSIKQRMVIAGYDLKFIKSALPKLEQFYQIRLDEWTGHNQHNESHSEQCLKWADIVFCEWLLGNAIWYSQRIKPHQKLFVRMHRFGLTTPWFKQVDFRKVNRVFAVSLYFFEKLVEYTRIPRSQACLLPNYLDSDNYQQSNNKDKLFNLAIIGILPSRKGYLNALTVLKRLVAKNKRYKLFVYGKMPEELSWIKNNAEEMAYFNQCNEFIAKHNLQKNVVIKGWVDVKTQLKDVGFVLSTSDNEEIPESFHIAPADGFSAGSQGVLLNWNGVEYIYPEQYIVQSPEQMADYILSHSALNKFNRTKQAGAELIKNRYSIDEFARNLQKQIHLSASLFAQAPALVEEEKAASLIAEIKAQKLTADGIVIKLPKEAQSNCKLMLEYRLKLSANTKINAALVSIKGNTPIPITGFNMSDSQAVGLYKYLTTTTDRNSCFIDINLGKEHQVEQLRLILWHKDTEIEVLKAKVFKI